MEQLWEESPVLRVDDVQATRQAVTAATRQESQISATINVGKSATFCRWVNKRSSTLAHTVSLHERTKKPSRTRCYRKLIIYNK